MAPSLRVEAAAGSAECPSDHLVPRAVRPCRARQAPQVRPVDAENCSGADRPVRYLAASAVRPPEEAVGAVAQAVSAVAARSLPAVEAAAKVAAFRVAAVEALAVALPEAAVEEAAAVVMAGAPQGAEAAA